MTVLVTDVRLETYCPAGDVEVAVTAWFDDGLAGSWAAFLDGAFVAGGTEPRAVPLGRGGSLVGRALEVSTVISDTRGTARLLAVHVALTGRAQTIDIVHPAPPGGRAAYSVLVLFSA